MLLTRKMLMVLGLCNEGLNRAESKNLLPIRVEDLTVDFILQNNINLYSVAIGLYSGKYRGYKKLAASQRNLMEICYFLKKKYLSYVNNDWFGTDRYSVTFPERVIDFIMPFSVDYLPELVKFLTKNWDDIAEATENYVEEDYDETE